jgi:acyl-CoA synthetase (AMP-forming)/AMP-acid ligase II
MNLGVAIVQNARRDASAVAVFEGDASRTYGELDERTTRLANAILHRFGVGRGERVVLLVHNRLEVVEVLGGCAKAGVTYCGLNFRLGEVEYESIFENAAPRLIITESDLIETARRMAARCGGIPVVDIDDGGPDGYEAVLATASAAQPPTLHEVRAADPFCIVYTSGTTGRPKGVVFDVGSVIQHATVAALEYELRADSRWLMAIPHNSSIQITMVPLLMMGGAIGFSDSRGWSAEAFTAEIRRREATHTFLVPTMLFRILAADESITQMPSLTTIGYGSSPIPPDRVRGLIERYGSIFVQLYGMAEIASIGTMLRKADHARALNGEERLLSSCGTPSYAIDVRVVDDEGQDLGPGDRGEVIFASPYTMLGYNDDPERTAEALVDGWMHSGDIGEWDEHGFLYIVDRKKDLIIRGGFNIVPTEVENVLYRHPAVMEASVFGVPDTEWGEAVMACVALRDGASVEPESLIAWCREDGLPTIKVPERVEILDALPKSAVGKILKKELRDRVWAGGPRV